ncbi:hypothetical protein EAH73_11755 [Hymenobacter nivis]|uniref:Glycosyltransferase RgtA/B/C/D-like domain-containing protein n=1 Tax=Hymenobacter nivis TaxID=1850093 RepID=A0A502GXE4_9BACT|nr:hypothetical protein EAH73_11755 [Hymenobacter nivis]
MLLLLLAGAGLVGLHLVLLYGGVPYGALAPALDAANAAAGLASAPWPAQPLAHNAPDYARLRAVAGGLLAAGALGLGFWRRAAGHEARRLAHDVRRAGRALAAGWRRTPGPARWAAGALLLAVAAVRTYLLAATPLNPDELVTLDYFVAPGPAVAAGFYLLPNNHVLHSLLVWPLLRGTPLEAPELLARLPVFGLGLVGLVVGFAGLARLTTWRVAALATLLFQFLPMGLEYAVTARGYGPQALCAQAAWLAALVLLRGPAGHRLAWAVWAGASGAGFYLIPTFLYPFAGSVAALVVLGRGRAAARRRRQALVAGAGVAVLAALLYLPVGWLTGWPLLLANPYVARLAPAFFWQHLLPYYVPVTVTLLYGRAVLGWPLLGLLALGPAAVRRWGAPAWRPAAWLAWAGAVAPVPLLLLQGVMPPGRTLYHTAWPALVLAGLALEAGARRWRGPGRAAWALAGALGLGHAGFRVAQQVRTQAVARRDDQSYRRVADWLAARPPGRVLVGVPGYDLYLAHQARRHRRPLPAMRGPDTRPGVRAGSYDYLVLGRGEALPAWLAPRRYRPGLCTGPLCVYQRAGAGPRP